ncbi:TLD-domain-containing protein [Chaetomium sp. MPI-SDFR-AT-0129]|nr:TLD-domain-containing protein [Chaetomium sp. MPI-SDFR-AT-0129]
MGQGLSNETTASLSHEELNKALAGKFAEECFTPIELYSLKDVFAGLTGQVGHLKPDTVAQFLELPEILDVSTVLFQIMSYIGAFPFLQDAPAILGLEQMVIVITVLTGRYRKVLSGGSSDRLKILFGGLAILDRHLSESKLARRPPSPTRQRQGGTTPGTGTISGSTVDEPKEDSNSGADFDEDGLVFSALEALGCLKPYGHMAPSITPDTMIPAGSMRKLVLLLLLIAPLGPQESLAAYSTRLSEDDLENLGYTADCVLETFLGSGEVPAVGLGRFRAVILTSMPYIFDGFTALFEHFLFSKNLEFHRHLGDPPTTANLAQHPVQPLFESTASIMNFGILSQLSFFIPGASLFRRLRLLYSGDEDGFSMGSFESRVFNWRAPTLLLVSGTRLSAETERSQKGPASTFLSTIPAQRLPPGNKNGGEREERLTYGVYLSQPWKHTYRECFGNEETVMFQLHPVHDVFHASTVNKDYASFTKSSPSSLPGGVSFGCPPPQPTHAYRRSNIMPLGSVSLMVEDSFEYGCFTHNYTSQGGAFQASAARQFDFQDRFEVSSIEVWGLGDEEEAKRQTERWAWEAREAEARRRVNLGTGDIEADRALLEMAGLVGANRSGGSVA